MFARSFLAGAFANVAFAGSILWDGRFNDLTSSTDLNNWSWSNQVGPYQYYIHGTGAVTDYVNLAADYKNPADTASNQGAKITIDSTSTWNGDSMLRTELIPQTKAAINAGKVWYHFSIKRSDTNAPSIYHEHQVAFFESHFTELKYGWISGEANTSDSNLQWMVGGKSQWAMTFDADVWHNVAYEIDFDGQTVSFYHSTGADALTLTAGPVSASTSSNGADWHLGVLRLQRDGYNTDAAEDWYFSGVYVEDGSLTTSVSYGGTSESKPVSSSSSSSAFAASSTAVTASTAAIASPTSTAVSSTVEAISSTASIVSSAAAVVSSSASASAVADPSSSVLAVSSVDSVVSSASTAVAVSSTTPVLSSSTEAASSAVVASSSSAASIVSSAAAIASSTSATATAPSASIPSPSSASSVEIVPTSSFSTVVVPSSTFSTIVVARPSHLTRPPPTSTHRPGSCSRTRTHRKRRV